MKSGLPPKLSSAFEIANFGAVLPHVILHVGETRLVLRPFVSLLYSNTELIS